jgi:signal transduction histidine kinase
LGEVTLVTNAFAMLPYLLALITNGPWIELLTIPTIAIYAPVTWRLSPGSGSLWWRSLRVLAWALLLALINGILSWLIVNSVPYSGELYGGQIGELGVGLGEAMASSVLIALGLILPTRLLLALWHAGQTRLRWRLTFSYLLASILTTLFIPIAFSSFIAFSSLAAVPLASPPDAAAQRVATLVTPLMQRDASSAELQLTLQSIIDGDLLVPATTDDTLPPTLTNLRRMTLLDPNGTVLASAGPAAFGTGAQLAVNEAAPLTLLREQLPNSGCVSGAPVDDTFPTTAACAILDQGGALAATLVVENEVGTSVQYGMTMARIIGITLISVSIVLFMMPLLIVLSTIMSMSTGYLLARRLTRRIEALTAATNDVAAGNLQRRVLVETSDEIGRLSTNFNAMAARLEERERALADEAARAEALLRANRQLIANVSHELRTPLATLRGYVEALEQEHGHKLPAHDLSIIRGETKRLSGLIDDLFTLARAEVQQLPLTLEPVDVHALAEELIATVAPLAKREREVELIAMLPAKLPPVCADRVRLEQVLLNLLHNALRYTPAGGIVVVEGTPAESDVTLTVADTGIGIPPEELPFVWERFFRGDRSRARETGGAGLGLALVRELVTAMGGTVAAQSTPGRGSRFSITLQQASAATHAHVDAPDTVDKIQSAQR